MEKKTLRPATSPPSPWKGGKNKKIKMGRGSQELEKKNAQDSVAGKKKDRKEEKGERRWLCLEFVL
jgi:hypothetical protein